MFLGYLKSNCPNALLLFFRIPGLSEKFLYINDDILLGMEIWPEDFLSPALGQKVCLVYAFVIILLSIRSHYVSFILINLFFRYTFHGQSLTVHHFVLGLG